MIYLDNQATTPIDPQVVEAMLPFLTENYGNPHSNEHIAGWKSAQAVEDSREQVAELINADPDEIIFTSGATESNNLAIFGILRSSYFNHLTVTEIEHKSSLECARYLAREGKNVSILPVDSCGVLSLNVLADSIQNQPPLVSIIGVNNEIGTIQNLNEIAKTTHECAGILHVDAAQMPIAKNIDVVDADIDLLSLSAHKIYGPKGIGALYIRRELQQIISPLFFGGGQENGIRPGTLPTPQIVGFGKAASLMLEKGCSDKKHLKDLTKLLFSGLSVEVPGIELNGPDFSNRHPGNLNVRIHGINTKTLLEMLQPDVAASTGSACSSGITEPSYVLQSIGLSYQEAEESLRFSIGRFTTEEDVLMAVEHLSRQIKIFGRLQ